MTTSNILLNPRNLSHDSWQNLLEIHKLCTSASSDQMKERLNSLPEASRHKIYTLVYDLKTKPETRDLQWSEQQAFDDLLEVGSALQQVAFSTLNLLNQWVQAETKGEHRESARNQIFSFLVDDNMRCLDLHRMNLTELPDIFCDRVFKQKLEKLYLYDNKLQFTPSTFCELTSLELLDLRNNELTQTPLEIGNFKSLKKLNLCCNFLQQISPQTFDLSALEQLNLSNNKLTVVPHAISKLTQLVHLQLNYNHLTKVSRLIGNLTSLTFLDLSANPLTQLPTTINKLSKLQYLNLWDNRFLNRLPLEVFDLPMTCTIDLSKCGFSTLTLLRFRNKTQDEGYRGPHIFDGRAENELIKGPSQD